MKKALAIILCSIVTVTLTLSASAHPHELRTTKFTVSDVDAAVEFYRDLVGMEEVGRFEVPGSLTEPFMGFGEGIMRVGLLGLSLIHI